MYSSECDIIKYRSQIQDSYRERALIVQTLTFVFLEVTLTGRAEYTLLVWFVSCCFVCNNCPH
jgi:hypothetical protein